jgi:hypothetical protein
VKQEATKVNTIYKNICTIYDPQLPITAPTRVHLIAAGGPIDNNARRSISHPWIELGDVPTLYDTVDFVR